jgi:hypothetical protein
MVMAYRMLTQGHSVRQLRYSRAFVILGLSCARQPAQPPAAATHGREVRVGHDYGVDGPGPLIVITAPPNGAVRGAGFAPRP